MQAKLQQLQEAFPSLSFSITKGVTTEWIEVKGFPGNPQLEVALFSRSIQLAQNLPLGELHGISGLMSFRHVNRLYVGLRPHVFSSEYDSEPSTVLLNMHMHYKSHDLKIALAAPPRRAESIPALLQAPLYLDIDGYSFENEELLSVDLRNICNAVLFELDFNFGRTFDLVTTEQYPTRWSRSRELPKYALELTYKEYIPDLLQYFSIGSKEFFLPFKFLSYYHVLEYWLNKSLYREATMKIKEFLMRPDFHLRPDHFIDQSIRVLRGVTTKNTPDSVKLRTTLQHFVDLSDYSEFLADSGDEQHFSNELSFDQMSLSLPAIDRSERMFYETLQQRIYVVRNSIVHSNPDFDERKADPFVPTPRNMEALLKETKLMHFLAKLIIVKSAIRGM